MFQTKYKIMVHSFGIKKHNTSTLTVNVRYNRSRLPYECKVACCFPEYIVENESKHCIVRVY